MAHPIMKIQRNILHMKSELHTTSAQFNECAIASQLMLDTYYALFIITVSFIKYDKQITIRM